MRAGLHHGSEQQQISSTHGLELSTSAERDPRRLVSVAGFCGAEVRSRALSPPPEAGNMPSGLRADTEVWVREHEEAKQLAQEIIQLIQERNINHAGGGPEASRKTATARRKMATLGTSLDKLMRWLESEEANGLSESEKNRRRDMVTELRNRREQMQFAIKRGGGAAEREQLFTVNGGAGASRAAAAQEPKETEATAELDARGLLVLQDHVMRQQDTELESMEKAISSTKHIALAIGEEADLQTALLDDLHDEVDTTNMRTRAATARIRQIMKQGSSWRFGLCIFLSIVVLVLVIVLVLKLGHLVNG
ncbi:hypothetical protein FOA52_009343 [Chlamydomonas sp. UWO 241]|nr:hypothetical protein FOA52_009343 [Chlamydomonas sp. UWO 241]